jgi:hypothetical protein
LRHLRLNQQNTPADMLIWTVPALEHDRRIMIPPVSTERRGDELQIRRPTISPSADLTTYTPRAGDKFQDRALVEWSRTDHVTLPADNPIMGGHLLTRVPGAERAYRRHRARPP